MTDKTKAGRVIVGGIKAGQMGEEEAMEVIEGGIGGGGWGIEISEAYGEGARRVGRVIRGQDTGHRTQDRGQVVMKSLERSGAGFRQEVEGMLGELGRGKAEIILLHDISSEEEIGAVRVGGALGEIRRMKEEGIAGEIGISGHYREGHRWAIGEGLGVIAAPYNLIDREMEGVMVEAKEAGAKVIGMKAYGGGTLLSEGYRAEELLHFVLSRPFIDLCLVGMGSREEAQAAFRWGRCPEGVPLGEVMLLLKQLERLPYLIRSLGDRYEELVSKLPCGNCQICGRGEELEQAEQRLRGARLRNAYLA